MSSRRRILVDSASPVPMYRQVADQIRTLLVAGEFTPGERLPTVRRLAIDLAVNHNTVAEAYRMLAEEGWLDLGRGRGALVLVRGTPQPDQQTRNRFTRRLWELVAEGRAAGVSSKLIRSELEAVAETLGTRIPARKT
jgi:GntR family transcriptional regulator